MGQPNLVWLAFLCAIALAGCGGGEDKDSKNNSTAECSTNADCAGAICDLSIGKCQVVSTNNTTGNNTTGATNNNSNNTTGNTTGDGVCGDGVVDAAEACDGDCPTECASTAPACQTGTLQGSAGDCSAECSYAEITACVNADGCCPTGCGPADDDDCSLTCGNGTLDANETCDTGINAGDGSCPTSDAACDDSNACTQDGVTGSPTTCSATCSNVAITQCVNGDGCCAPGCNMANDDDCGPAVGEACASDADCPASAAGAAGFCMVEDGYRWPGGFCTAGCSLDSDCASGEHCNGRVCMPDCTSDADCRAGYSCYDYFGTGEDSCAPTVGTGEISGGACTTDDDCLGALFGAICDTNEDFPQGYCLSACQLNEDCAAGTHCGTTSGGGQVCVPDCGQDADCRSGYECFNWLGDFTNTCGPVANGAGQVGEACDLLQDCTGGQLGVCIDNDDWFGGTCSQTCGPNDLCPNGTHCSFIDNLTGRGLCLDDCATGNDCRTNYSCVNIDEVGATECAPSGEGAGVIGATCNGVYDCSGGIDAFCIRETQGWRAGYCSLTCSTDADCGTGAHCGAQDANGDGVCVADCASGADCRADGYACFEWDDSTVASSECAPSGTGNSPIGGACEGVWECGGGPGAFCLQDASGWTDGYCADSGCTSNADCGTGAHCGFFNTTTQEGTCIANCTSDANCRGEYGCFDADADAVTECLPEGDGRVGDACESFADCAGRENAICAADPNFPDGMCLLDCGIGSGVTCGAGTACVAFTGVSACVPTCTSSADCRAGYLCQSDGTNNVCLP